MPDDSPSHHIPSRPAPSRRYLRGLARRHFSALRLGGPPSRRLPAGPVLFVANHTNWWDGFLACLVTERLGREFQILMEAVHLERYWMFNRVGALPMHRGSARQAWADLERAARYLQRPRTGLWIFPQGARRPPRAALADTERGAAHLALAAGRPLTIWPVAFRYAYLGEQLPEAFIWLGQPMPWRSDPPEGWQGEGTSARARRGGLHRRIEAALQATVSALDARLTTEDLSEMDLLLPGRLSINKRLDRARHALGFLRGRFDPRNG